MVRLQVEVFVIGRWIGIDYGRRRIGVACSDRRGTIASPAAALPGTGSASNDADRILKWVLANEGDGVVVGLPLNMDGSDSQQTKVSRDLASRLSKRGQVVVELWDERLSSFQADQLMDAAEVKHTRRRGLRDALAAQVILQSFLDARLAEKPDIAPAADVDGED